MDVCKADSSMHYHKICLLTIYRLPFKVSGRVSDGAYSGQFFTKVLSEAKRKKCKLFEGVSPSFCNSAERA